MFNTLKKLKRIYYIISVSVLAVFLFVLSPAAHADDPEPVQLTDKCISLYQEQLYSSSNGLPTGEANTVVQTRDGYIWIGGYGGLMKYDGISFYQISGTNGLSSYSIRSLFEDRDGNLYVGSNEQGAFVFDGKTFTRIETPLANRYLSARSFCQDSSGRIWIGTSDGLLYYENGRASVFDMTKFSIKNSIVYTLSSASDGTIWGVDGAGAVFGLDTEKMSVPYYFAPGSLWADNIYAYSAACTKDGKLFVGTSTSDIYCIDAVTSEPAVTTYSGGMMSGVNSIFPVDNGDIWLCGDTGIGAIHEGKYFDCSFLDNARHLISVFVDYEGNVWAASTKSGVIKLSRSKVCSLSDADMLKNNETYAIAFDGKNYYAGYEAGLAVFDENFHHIENDLTQKLQGTHIHSLALSPDGKMYIGSYYSGLYIYDPLTGALDNITLPGSTCREILKLSDGTMAAGTNAGVDIIDGKDIIASYSFSNKVLCMLEMDNGVILVGTDGDGIYKIENGESARYADTSSGLSGGVILRMYRDTIDSKIIWVSCGSDLFYGNDKGFNRSPKISSGAGSILDIAQKYDELWIFRSSGIICADRSAIMSSDAANMEKRYYSQSEGIPGPIVANSWNYRYGNRFLICTNNGIGYLDIDDLYTNNVTPKSDIADITFSDDCVWDGSSSLTLNKDISKITFYLSALTFSGDDIKTSVFLEGMDEAPVVRSLSDQHEVSYTNLPAGSYRFHFNVINSDGVSGVDRTVSIEKQPKFAETPWLYVVIVLGALIISGIIWLIRIRQVRAKQELYKKITNQSISVISGIVDAKDSYTQGHSSRVADYSVEIAKRMGMKKDDIERLYYIALLHDVGKIGVPDDILKKPSRLTDDEFHKIQLHVNIGGEILKNFSSLDGASEGALYHHERYDGKGYPSHISHEDIPLFARIICVADSLDAMSSSRCYRKALPKDVIISELKKGEGTQFDPEIAKIGEEIANEILKDEE